MGHIESNDGDVIHIYDTIKEGNLTVHLCNNLPKKIDQIFKAVVDQNNRYRIQCNHTATHLLHQALKNTLGNHVEQKGSRVSSENFRFDFSHFSKLDRKDIVAQAQSGTGKTGCFTVGTLQIIDCDVNTTQAMLLSPTRELAIQTKKVIDALGTQFSNLRTQLLIGVTSTDDDIQQLYENPPHVVIGCPGRIHDMLRRKKLKSEFLKIIVLDEADEMLNMGFKDDLDIILAETPEEKQTLLFSATMPKEVMRITKDYMFSPKTIEVASRNEGAKDVEHHYYMVNARDRYQALRRICDVNSGIYGIVFCRTRRETKDIADKLIQDGYNADALHGELSQSQRDHVMKRFRKKSIQILVATDVAARGIDINELTHVINYNLPDDNEIYIHRSGRTGRAGNKGISIIIAHSRERRKIQSIEKMLKKELILKKVPSGEEICEIQLLKLVDKVVNTKVGPQIEKYIPNIKEKFSHLDKDELIKHFSFL